MIRRRVMAAGLLSAALLPLLGLPPALAAKKKAAPKVKLSSPKLSTKSAKGGAQVRAQVVVQATGGATVSTVNLRIVRTGASASSASMSPSGKRWTGSFSAPANYSGRTVNVDVWADAQTSLGVKSLKVGTLKVASTAIDSNSPPPPPPI